MAAVKSAAPWTYATNEPRPSFAVCVLRAVLLTVAHFARGYFFAVPEIWREIAAMRRRQQLVRRALKDGRPGVRPEASEVEPTYSRGESMHSVPQARPVRRSPLGRAQLLALRRWHRFSPHGALLAELASQPRFPLVVTPTPGHVRRLRPTEGGPTHVA